MGRIRLLNSVRNSNHDEIRIVTIKSRNIRQHPMKSHYIVSLSGICPVTRCAKRMLNGPCGDSREDRCEVRADSPCAWQLIIYARLKEIGQLDNLRRVAPPKDWSYSINGGQRLIVRQEHRI
jgi:hypothetical protein